MVFSEIPLSGGLGSGKVMKVDEDLVGTFNSFSWRLDTYGYAVSSVSKPDGEKVAVKAHHIPFCETVYYESMEQVHHKNNDPLDNRRANLVPVKVGSAAGRKLQSTVQDKQKTMNGTPTSSKYKGVYWNKMRGMWCSQYVDLEGSKTNVGYFDSQEEAAAAYNKKVAEIIKVLEEQVMMEWEDVPI